MPTFLRRLIARIKYRHFAMRIAVDRRWTAGSRHARPAAATEPGLIPSRHGLR